LLFEYLLDICIPQESGKTPILGFNKESFVPSCILSVKITPVSWKKSVVAVSLGLAGIFSSQVVLAFNFDDVADQARTLSQQAYKAPTSQLPDSLTNLDYKHYSEIQFKSQDDLWRGDNLPFDISFFHQGMRYSVPVQINQIVNGKSEPLQYSPDQFDFGDNKISQSDLQKVNGYAGFRVNYALNGPNKQEMMVFLGASYFRAIGADQRYGSSGRGLAINTALSSGEEFPRFREFWIAKPQPDDPYLLIYALLDSPSATGAYRFVVRPGSDTLVDVREQLFLRHGISKIGIAPLTSMYLYSPSEPSSTVNYRPAIHDADGLSIESTQQDGSDAWLWRQLVNPERLNITDIDVPNLRGFGLMQRDHHFSDYQDLDARYDQRPSVWIQPTSNWGPGQVELVEIPTPDETNDNIVAYWRPKNAPQVGTPVNYEYRMIFTRDEQRLQNPDLAWVSQTRRSVGETLQDNLVRKADGSTAYIIDFMGPNLKDMSSDSGVTAEVKGDQNGDIVSNQVVRNPVTDGFRLILKVRPKDSSQPINLSAYIKDGTGHRLSETWSTVQEPDD